MNSALPALVPAIGWALLHFIWQGLLIGWGVTLSMHLLRGARPQARYAVGCGAMLLCAALPLASVLMHLADAGDAAAAVATVAVAGQGGAETGSGAVGAIQGAVATAIPTLFDDAALAAAENTLRRQLPWVVGLWLAGAALMSLRLAVGLRWVTERTSPDEYTVNHYWQRRLSELARRFDIETHVRLGVADKLDSPITAGCWRPIVLVPAALVTGMPADFLEALLAHELAHIKRHDYLVNLIQSAIEIVLFYHPSVWALSRRIRIEREQIADDLAVAKLGQPQKLAQALSELDRFQFATTQLAHAAHGGNLMSRIKRLLRPDVEPVSWKMALPMLGLCAAGAVFYAHAAPQPPAVPEPPAPPALVAAAELPEPPALAAPVAPPAPAVAPVVRERVAPAAPAAPALRAPAVPAAPVAAAAPPAPAAMPAPSALAAPAAPAAPQLTLKPGARAMQFQHMSMSYREQDLNYALVPRDSSHMIVSATHKDLRVIADMRETLKSDFIWFREGDKAYVIQDSALVAKASEAWEPSNRISKAMDEQGKKMDGHGKVMDAIGARMDAKTREAESGPTREMERQHRQIEQLGRQQEAIGRRMELAARKVESDPSPEKMRQFREQQAKLQAEMAPLSKQMAQLSREVSVQSAKLQQAQEPLRAMEREMAEASKPMAELSQRMQELSREQARASREAETALKALIRDAIKNGKATPASSATPAA